MRAVLWITETGWEACADLAARVVPADADVVLLHVASGDVEALAAGPHGLLGRRHRPGPGPGPAAISDAEAEALLEDVALRLGRPAERLVRRGHVEREVVAAVSGADLLVLTRDGDDRPGPRSLDPRARFVVDHAPCPVLLAAPLR